MQKIIEITFSEQAQSILDQMPKISIEKLIEWYCKKTIVIGGGDLVDYLSYLKLHPEELKNG